MFKGTIGFFLTLTFFFCSSAWAFAPYEVNFPAEKMVTGNSFLQFTKAINIKPKQTEILLGKCQMTVAPKDVSRRINAGQIFKIGLVTTYSYPDQTVSLVMESNTIQGINCPVISRDRDYKYAGIGDLESDDNIVLGFDETQLEYKDLENNICGYFPKVGIEGEGIVMKFYDDEGNGADLAEIAIVDFDSNQWAISGVIEYLYDRRPSEKRYVYAGPLWGGIKNPSQKGDKIVPPAPRRGNGFLYNLIVPHGDEGRMDYKDGSYDVGRWQYGVLIPETVDKK